MLIEPAQTAGISVEKMKREALPNVRVASTYPPFTLDIHEAEHYLSVGRSLIYDAVHAKKLPMHKVGGKTLFYRTDLEEWIVGEMRQSMPIPKGATAKRVAEKTAATAAPASTADA